MNPSPCLLNDEPPTAIVGATCKNTVSTMIFIRTPLFLHRLQKQLSRNAEVSSQRLNLRSRTHGNKVHLPKPALFHQVLHQFRTATAPAWRSGPHHRPPPAQASSRPHLADHVRARCSHLAYAWRKKRPPSAFIRVYRRLNDLVTSSQSLSPQPPQQLTQNPPPSPKSP